MPSKIQQRVRFGEIEIDVHSEELHKNGRRRRLPRQSFRILLILLDRPGEVVSREELRKELWSEQTYVDFEHGLNSAIRRLREALGDSAEQPKFIETLPRLGYRYLGPQSTRVPGSVSTDTAALSEVLVPPSATGRRHISRISLYVFLAAVTIATLYRWSLGSDYAPRVIGITPITHSGRVDPWGRIVSDGTRLFFLEREGDHWNLAQTSINGGETQLVAAPFKNTRVLDLSPNHSEFLIATFQYRSTEMPLWIWPVQGGAPKRIGDISAYDAVWHPDGQWIVYGKDDGIYLADKDGNHIHMLAHTNGRPGTFSWSADGKLMRFSVFRNGVPGSTLWEIRTEGTELRQVLPGWSDPATECCGTWSRDGSYFYFNSVHGGPGGLWSLHNDGRLSKAKPHPLTLGEPTFLGPPLPSQDDARLYVTGVSLKDEVVSYIPKSHIFSTVLQGTRADSAAFSQDGNSIAFITLPDSILWRARKDGSDRHPLTSSAIHATMPVWSPDGTQIAFINRNLECENRIYVVAAAGGLPRELFPDECQQFDPAWSPDGRLLAFARLPVSNSGTTSTTQIELLDLSSNQVSVLPGSEGLRSPSWSPDGRYLAAVSEDLHRIQLLNVQTKHWSELCRGTLFNGTLKWSPDGTFLYYQDFISANEAVYRVRLKDRRREEIVSFESYIRAGVPRCAFADLTPDGSIIAVLLRSHADIFALQLSYR